MPRSRTVKPQLTQARLKELFTYDPLTGDFTPRTKRMGRPPRGDKFAPKVNGYVMFTVEGEKHYAHRLAFLYMTGKFPPPDMEVDHRDMDRGNNRWKNLRLATHSENQLNKAVTSANAQGIKGLCWDSRNARWHAYSCDKHRTFPPDGREEAIEWLRKTRESQSRQFARH